jgi:hypothetical protein
MIAYVPSLVFRKVKSRADAQRPAMRPVRLRDWLGMRRFLRRLSDAPDALVPPLETFRGTGASLSDPELARMLETDDLGTWALDAASIETLWESLRTERPSAVLEFGAGVSTLLLARYARWCAEAGAERPIVVSLEQDQGVRQKTMARLESLGLAEGVHILHAPLSQASRYQIDFARVGECLAGRAVEWVLVDGPAGPEGCRDTTLPDVMSSCGDGARWFLDDALRDGELGILRRWSRLREVEIDGILPIGNGLATGRLVRRGSRHEGE